MTSCVVALRESYSTSVSNPPLGLYVHFPWCVRKCPYCDFNSHPLKGPLRENEYATALLADLDRELALCRERTIETIYFGGGTPSLFSAPTFRRLIERLPNRATEITMEANPGTVEHGGFAAYRRAGVTRVSLGAQSFDAAQLKRLGRIHGADEVRAAARHVAASGFESFNIDLMYGLQNQTPRQALADLAEAIRLAPPHISWYQLTVEPKTEFARRPPRLPNADQAAAIEDAGVELLAQHGYRRYEVSSFALDGHRCAHNVNYWQFGDYLGIGAGAHGKLTSQGRVVRTAKPSQPRLYLAGVDGTAAPIPEGQLAMEFLMNALRLVDGVDRQLLAERTGLAPQSAERVARTIDELVRWGLMRSDRLALTARGYRQLDGVLARFL